jgi:hypothetical protein
MCFKNTTQQKTNDAKVSNYFMCCFSAKDVALRSKTKDWLFQNNLSERSDMSTRGLLFQ